MLNWSNRPEVNSYDKKISLIIWNNDWEHQYNVLNFGRSVLFLALILFSKYARVRWWIEISAYMKQFHSIILLLLKINFTIHPIVKNETLVFLVNLTHLKGFLGREEKTQLQISFVHKYCFCLETISDREDICFV